MIVIPHYNLISALKPLVPLVHKMGFLLALSPYLTLIFLFLLMFFIFKKRVLPGLLAFAGLILSLFLFLTYSAFFIFPNDLKIWNPGDIRVGKGGGQEIKVVFMADLHFGSYRDGKWVKRLTEAAAREKPDLLLLGGDYVYGDPPGLDKQLGYLGNIPAPMGKFAVLGNHDYGIPGVDVSKKIEKIMSGEGIKVLHNQWVTVGDGFVLIGVDDLWRRRADLNMAFKDVPENLPRLVLAHNPDILLPDPQNKYRADLWLFGHTHGGQLRPPWGNAPYLPTRLKLDRGLFELPRGKAIVTQGTAQFYARFFTNPEIVTFKIIVPENKR
ncbi:MAG: metallophosphoesterase [Chloroflexi bacterium]|nr:metallophosphoesterase [Chloroflexota bacterium]